MVKEGAVKPPFCVLADLQTKGKGQRGKEWTAEKGQNLLASFLLNGDSVNPSIAALNAIGALAVVKTLEGIGIRQVKIKWPNDVYLGDLKLAGVLTENIFQGDKLKYTIVGVGLNVNQTDFPDELRAASLKAITGKDWNIYELVSVLNTNMYNTVNQDLKDLVLEVNSRLYKKGKNVTFQNGEEYNVYNVNAINALGELEVYDGNTSLQLQHHIYKWVL